MKRSISLIIFFMVLLSSLFAIDSEDKETESFYARIIPLLEKNPEYKKLSLGYTISKREMPNELKKWLPKAYIDVNSDLSGVIIDKNYYALNLNSKLVIEQNLPLASQLELFTTQNNNIFFKSDKPYAHNFSTGASLNIPAWFIAPALIDDYINAEKNLSKEQKKYLDLSIKNQKNLLMLKAISTLTVEKILKAKIDLLEKEIDLSEKEKEKNDLLFEQGKISNLEVSKFEKEHKEKISKKFELESEYAKVISELNSIGLSQFEIYETLDEWLSFLEKYTNNISPSIKSKSEVLKLKYNLSKLEEANNLAKGIPKIYMGCNFDFITPEKNYKNFSSSIKEYWKSSPKLKWSVFMALRLNLNPLASEYKINKNYKLRKKINSIENQ